MDNNLSGNLQEQLLTPQKSNLDASNIQGATFLSSSRPERKRTFTSKSRPCLVNSFQPKISSEDIIEYKQALINLLRSSVPSILTLMFVFIYDNLNIIFADKYLEANSVSAIGVGSFYINASGFILGIGLLGGMDTFCAQAYGAKSYYLLGLYVNVSRIVVIGFFIFGCLPFILASEYILEIMRQPQEIIILTSDYIKSMIPSVFFALQFYVSNHYLQSMNLYFPGMLITFITASLHSLWLYIFIGVMGFSVKGIGYSMGVTHMLNFIIITAYIDNHKPNEASYIPFDANATSLKRIFEFVKISVPSALMFASDWLGFHILILYSSYIDMASLTANVSIFNFYTLFFSIPAGLSFATCMYIGNMMGSNRVHTAKIYATVSSVIGTLTIFIIMLFLLLFRSYLPFIYTRDERVANIFSHILSFLVYFGVFDALQIILNGILKGLGKQKPASLLTLIVLFPINVPMSLTFAFSLNYKLVGLWYAQLTAVVFLGISYLVMMFCLDWENNAQRTVIRIAKINEQLKKKMKKLMILEIKIN